MPRYQIDLHYQTPNGSASSVRYEVEADNADTAIDAAEVLLRADGRRAGARIYAGDSFRLPDPDQLNPPP